MKVRKYTPEHIEGCVICGKEPRYIVCNKEGEKVNIGEHKVCSFFCVLTLCEECLKELCEALKGAVEKEGKVVFSETSLLPVLSNLPRFLFFELISRNSENLGKTGKLGKSSIFWVSRSFISKF